MIKQATSTAISFALLLALLLFSFFCKLTYIPIRIWDEARNANNAFAMHLHGNWLIPYYEGSPDMWNTKPPLLIWMQVICMKLWGVSVWAVRFPAALFATTTGLLLWAFCRRYLQQVWVGMLAGAILATTFAYVHNHAGRTGDYDAPLVFFSVAYCFSMYLYLTDQNRKWLIYFWVFLTFATLTKGIAGLLLVPGIAAFILIRKKLKEIITTKQFYIGLGIFLLLVGGYYLLREQYNPGYLKAVTENELGGRYLAPLEGNGWPFDFYWNTIKNRFYPFWKWFVFPAFIGVGLLGSYKAKSITTFNLLVIIPYFLVISAAKTKLEWYPLPIYPFLALQIALLLQLVWQKLQEKIPASFRIFFVIAILMILFTKPVYNIAQQIFFFKEQPWDIEPHAQGAFINKAIREKKDLNNYVFFYEGYSGHLQFYMNKLQHEGVNTRLQSAPEGLQAGMLVVVNQAAAAKKLSTLYRIQKVNEQSGCTIYLIQGVL
jgi:4-amino-4-deoxy-L-arabinose transferase-like glycosyltransferase